MDFDRCDILTSIGVVFLIIALIFVIVFLRREFSDATTPVNVIHPVDGVSCVKIITSDGAAIDCWKD